MRLRALHRKCHQRKSGARRNAVCGRREIERRHRFFEPTQVSFGGARCVISMHELSIAIGLVELASEEAARQGHVRVDTLYVRLGARSGVVSSALRFSFDVAASGTAIEGAVIEIEEVAGRTLELAALEVTDVAADCGSP